MVMSLAVEMRDVFEKASVEVVAAVRFVPSR
jgi:hypothetical protein